MVKEELIGQVPVRDNVKVTVFMLYVRVAKDLYYIFEARLRVVSKI